jgi:glycosyltransferase involved in cell wall biosynthesis
MFLSKIIYIHHYGDQHQNREINSVSDGGTNIHTNLIEKLSQEYSVTISTYQDNYVAHNLFDDNKKINIVEHFTLSGLFKKNLLFFELPIRILYPSSKYLFFNTRYRYVFTQTDFLPDTLTGFFLKIKHPKIHWVASFFLNAPKPLSKNNPYKGAQWLKGFFYYLLQFPSFWLINQFADTILVTSDPDQKQFLSGKKKNIIVVRGGVDITLSEKYLSSNQIVPVPKRQYDACFLGRLHDQKGVLEMIDIWKNVCLKKSKAKLAVIGIGPLENALKRKIRESNLKKNIDLLGYLTGEAKYSIFKQSKVMIHPATYDSGGMAVAEGMAWKLPAVSFDLEALKTYYPEGMLKTECYNVKKFAQNILDLLSDKTLYNRVSQEAHQLIRQKWDWQKQSKSIINQIIGYGETEN